MSEYQYYEFRALDRRLTPEEMAELRQLSTRATITPTSFVNEYHYGDFRGEPVKLLEEYFDAFLYMANWGTRELMFRLPDGVLDLDLVGRYFVDEHLEAWSKGGNLILRFETQVGSGWIESGEGELDVLLPLRDELQNGDLRSLYVGWLSYAAGERQYYADTRDEDDDESEEGAEYIGNDDAIEPPVPPGLRTLSPALTSLAGFLDVDDDLLAVAAERSGPQAAAVVEAPNLRGWLRGLPAADATELLARLVEGDAVQVRAELLTRFRRDTSQPSTLPSGLTAGSRSVAELCALADRREAERRRIEAERKAQEQARRDHERAVKRRAYLDDLAGRQVEVWRQVEWLINARKPAEYDQAVQLLRDLRAVAELDSALADFEARLGQLRAAHAKKASFISRLDSAALR